MGIMESMAGYSKIILMGNLVADPELRFLSGGMAVGSFTLAVNSTWRDKEGEKKEDVAYIDCKAWGKTAENLDKHKRKGDPLLVEGRLKQDIWEDKNTGAKRSKLYVDGCQVTYLGAPKEKTEEARPDPQAQAEFSADDTPF